MKKDDIENNQDALLEREIWRLVKSALAVEALPMSAEKICQIEQQAALVGSDDSLFPLAGLLVLAGSLFMIVALESLLPGGMVVEWVNLKILSMTVLVANFVLSPLAALMIVRRRKFSYAK